MRLIWTGSFILLSVCGQQAYAFTSKSLMTNHAGMFQQSNSAPATPPAKATDPPIDPDKPGGPTKQTDRADAVVRYLVENHNIPIRRIITPYGLGEAQAVADNKSRQGRAQNRRVEVKILVNKGLQQGAPTMTTPGSPPSIPHLN